ncbi:MAG: glycosyltransferase family 4 protein [Archangium sp.]
MKFLLVTPRSDVPSGGHLYNQRIAELTGCDVAPLEHAKFQRVNVIDSLYLGASNLPDDFVWLLHWLPDGHDVSRARGIIVTSEFMASRVRAQGFTNVAVCEPGLDDRYFEPPRKKAGHHVLTVANFLPHKGHPALIEEMKRVKEPWTWELIGAFEDQALVDEFRERLHGFESRVTLRGSCSPDEVFEAYERADVFALLPQHEAYGMVFAEAAARGLSIVAPDIGEIPRIVGSARSPDVSSAFRDRPTRTADFPRWSQTAANFTAALQRWFP